MRDLAKLENRRPTKQINVGGVAIGNRNPVSIQTMTTTLTYQVDETMHQIDRCVEAGAQIVRVAVPEQRDADALKAIVTPLFPKIEYAGEDIVILKNLPQQIHDKGQKNHH